MNKSERYPKAARVLIIGADGSIIHSEKMVKPANPRYCTSNTLHFLVLSSSKVSVILKEVCKAEILLVGLEPDSRICLDEWLNIRGRL